MLHHRARIAAAVISLALVTEIAAACASGGKVSTGGSAGGAAESSGLGGASVVSSTIGATTSVTIASTAVGTGGPGTGTGSATSTTVASSSTGTMPQCTGDTDCMGYPAFVCSSMHCVPATCNDAKKDGNETGVDCGGNTCPACPVGSGCAKASDCQSGVCSNMMCAPCGGATQPCCAGGACNAAPNTCVQNTATQWGGTAQECDCGVLLPGQELQQNQSRWSCDGRFYLVMQTDGNLVLYWNGQGALWSSNTANTAGNRAIMQSDGNFVVYAGSTPLWSSNTNAGPANDRRLAIQTDGNVVVYTSANAAVWSTSTCCH